MKKPASLLTVSILLFLQSHSQCTVPDTLFVDDTIVVCQGTTFQLDAPVIAGATYTWSTSEANSSVMLGVNGRYWVQINDGVCAKADTVTVLFNSFLLSPPVQNLKLCKDKPAMPINVTGQQVQWYTDPIGGTAYSIQPVPSTIDTGRTTYWFTQTIRGCESPRIPMLVTVIDTPKFDLGEAFIIPCNTLGITLQVVDDGESDYTWSNGSHEVSIVAPHRGRYWIMAQNMCGIHRDSTIAVECQDKCVQFATAFTPNNDGKNDKYQAACFCPVPKFKLMIFNRNGEMVFQTSNPEAGWNGYYQNKLQPNGAYVYYTEFFDFVLKQSFTQKGSFVLLR